MIARLVLAALSILVLATGCLQPGVRLLHVDYMVDGEVLLRTYYEDPDANPAADVWDYLDQRPIMCAQDLSGVAARDDDPYRAELTGDVIVEILHVKRSLGRAATDHLTLIRTDPDDQRWYLSPAELTRIRP